VLLNFSLILIIFVLGSVFVKTIRYYMKKKKTIPIDNLILDIFWIFLYINGMYAGFSVSYYGVFRTPFPGADVNFMYISLAAGGVMIFLASLWQMILGIVKLE